MDGAASVWGVPQLPTDAGAWEDLLTLHLGFCGGTCGTDALPGGAMVEDSTEQVSQHEPEQPPGAGFSLQAKEKGPEFVLLLLISVCAAHAEYEVCWTNALLVNKELNS